ncbi:MAG: helix-turn-helix domain-containing protein [Erysipelotrichaceae bacterium]|nr:helix-turn-helix domain-containing protein [Erysipelotrichaceae bacterium]
MLKLVYDLKAGFEDEYIVLKNKEFDLTQVLDFTNEAAVDSLPDDELNLEEVRNVDEESFYEQYKDNIDDLLEYLEGSGWMDMEYESSVLDITKTYFLHRCGRECIVPMFEPSNFRIVYDESERSDTFYLNALTPKEVCDMLKINKQQLHYYVKTGQIRKEYNSEGKFKYNRVDVYVLNRKLQKKYDKHR